jgi:alkaline phosphatase D
LKYAGEEDRYQFLPHRTKTAPKGPADFRIAFGSCCRIQFDPDQRIWNAVRGLEPDMFLWLGDNVYADTDQRGALVDLYGRGRVVERLEPLLRSTPQLATWDDHDFGYNNSDGLNPFKDESLQVFRNFWANPASGEADNAGVYFKQHYGGVDFFVLDGRYHRDPIDKTDDAAKTMLGARQKAWLKRELKASRTPFKVLAIGGGWSCAENEKGGDSWGVYLTERNEIFDFIRDEGIGGGVCISGDSHMGELNCIPRSGQGGYDLYDFCSSPLAQMPAAKNTRQMPEVRVRDTWTRSVNVGVMRMAAAGATADGATLASWAGATVAAGAVVVVVLPGSTAVVVVDSVVVVVDWVVVVVDVGGGHTPSVVNVHRIGATGAWLASSNASVTATA